MNITSEANNYVVGMITKYGITKLETGKTYSAEGATVRAKELNETCQAELKALGGNMFVSVSVYS